MITGDSSRKATDTRLREMEKHLTDIYTRAGEEVDKKAQQYFSLFEGADEKKRKDLDSGKITEEDYKKWRKNKLLYGERYSDFQKNITAQLANVNKTALAYLNGEIPDVYVLNYNDMGSSLADVANENFRAGVSFDLVDADTVRILATENPDLLPYKELDETKDIRWNTKKINSEILQGILLGEPVPDIAARLHNVVGMNERSAITNARTMVTGAENRGRMESMQRAESNGIVLQRIWMSAEDGRVRNAHAELNGEKRDIDKPFHNEFGEIMYPGDPTAAPANVYNCRCTLGTEIIGFRDPIVDESANTENNILTNESQSAIINQETITYKQFSTGQETNDFFYYDGEERGLKARKNSSHARWQNSLTQDEKDSIYDYTGGGYSDLNKYLRKTGDWQAINAEKEEFIAQNLDSAISRYELKDNIMVQRGVMNDVIDHLAEQNDVQNSLDELVGKKFIDNGYMSTTTLYGNSVAAAKPTIIDIEIPAGIGRGAYVNQLAGQYQDTEYEFLLKRGASFTIKEIKEEEIMGEFHYYLKLVMDNE